MLFLNRAVLLLLFGLVISACSSSDKAENETPDEPVYKVLTAATLQPNDPIPVPADAPILTVTGLIKNTNQGDTLLMDMAAIESVGQVEYTVLDPFEETTITYQGVLLSDLLALWGVDPAAKTLSVVALNDYQVNIPLDDLRQYPVIFAVRRNGEYMPVSTRGPAMLVFPYNHYEFELTEYNDYWVWQIKSIDVQ